ncbi:MAG: hypothetical protein NC200_07195 [Candidatus Gastranaerophilales bacterium]|nr:hypothetical protein [Candidatus Gastranaerophilales bacterium]
MSLSIGKKYLYDIAKIYLGDDNYDDEIVSECYRDIDTFISGIEDKDILKNFKLPFDLAMYIGQGRGNITLANDLDTNMPVMDEWGMSYSFHKALLQYMRQGYKWLKADSKTGKTHLYFKFKPTTPSDYTGIDDIKTEYDSFLLKFYLNKYTKYTDHTQTSKEGCAYCIVVLYLVVLRAMYNILYPFINGDVETFLKICFRRLNPVISGLTMTAQYNTGKRKALSVIAELRQLSSQTPSLTIDKTSEYNAQFIYVPKTNQFKNSSEKPDNRAKYRTDNNGKRRIELLITGKDNLLTLRYDLIGMSILNDITGLAGKKDFLSISSNKEFLEHISRKVLLNILSHTSQFFQDKRLISDKIDIFYDDEDDIPLTITKTPEVVQDFLKAQKEECLNEFVFKRLKPDTLAESFDVILNEFKLNKYQMDYIIIAHELAKLKDDEVSKSLSVLGSKQQAELRKMINRIQERSRTPFHALNYIYKRLVD